MRVDNHTALRVMRDAFEHNYFTAPVSMSTAQGGLFIILVLPTLADQHLGSTIVLLLQILCAVCWAERMFNIISYYCLKVWNGGQLCRNAARPFVLKLEGSTANGSTLSAAYPKVVVQLPMCNEEEICCGAIDACASLNWPASSLILQVLDDSTDIKTRSLIDSTVCKWKKYGMNIECIRRDDRSGFKAANLQHGLDRLTNKNIEYEYVTMFDARFRPDPAFLTRTIPVLQNNLKLAFAQTRFVFRNSDHNLLTKAQEIYLTHLARCEHFTSSCFGSFFFCHGTAVVWRRAHLEAYGGWNPNTASEDVDISLSAYIHGRKAVYLEHVTCMGEVTTSFAAYRDQQYRWTKGPLRVYLNKLELIRESNLNMWRKVDVGHHFIVRRVLRDFFQMGFVPICILGPLSLLFRDTFGALTPWLYLYMPLIIASGTVSVTPGGLGYVVPYLLFTNSMTLVRLRAIKDAFFQDSNVPESWVSTGDKTKKQVERSVLRQLLPEALFAFLLLMSGAYGIYEAKQVVLACWVFTHGLAFLLHIVAYASS